MIVVIDACSLQNILENTQPYWEGIKENKIITGFGKPTMIRHYRNIIENIRRDSRENQNFARGVRLLREFFNETNGDWINEEDFNFEDYNFSNGDIIPRKDQYLFIIAKEIARKNQSDEAIIITNDSGVLDATDNRNGDDIVINTIRPNSLR